MTPSRDPPGSVPVGEGSQLVPVGKEAPWRAATQAAAAAQDRTWSPGNLLPRPTPVGSEGYNLGENTR